MRIRHRFYNIYKGLVEFVRMSAFVIAPLIGILIYIVLYKIGLVVITNADFVTNIIAISGTFAGFLFTGMTILSALPENKFTGLLKSSKTYRSVLRVYHTGMLLLILAVLVGLFTPWNELLGYIFVAGVSELVLAAYYLTKITRYSNQSK